MGSKLKVLTLNCWGVFIPIACEKRHQRMDAIGKELSKGEYDIILLQEIWTQSDFNKLSKMIAPALPHTHYWHSGVIGSGVCIFSKHPIIETSFWRFHCNGHAHKVHHGDWYGSKGVGMATVLVADIKINVYSTHLHAQYNEKHDEYEAHRLAQAFEMSQFIKLTSETCDLVIVGGDLNLQPHDLGYKVIKDNGNVKDAWTEQQPKIDDISFGATNYRHSNSFTTDKEKSLYPHGQRIDYLMFRNNSGYDIDCDMCYLTMEQIPGRTYHYSDHEGVAAIFIIKKNITAMSLPRDTERIGTHLTSALPILDHGLKQVKRNRIFYYVFAVVCLFSLVMTSDIAPVPHGLGWCVGLIRLLICGAFLFYVWMGVIMSEKELNGLLSARKDVKFALKSNSLSSK